MGETIQFLSAAFIVVLSFIHTVCDENVSEQELTDVINFLPINMSLGSAANISKQFTAARDNEDVHLNIVQLIQKYGYNVETHHVQTSDGYKLTLFRIPRNGSVVFLMHGLVGSADDWVTAGPVSGIAYLLAGEGYDVWLGNARGNKHSRRHARLSPESAEFWDFTWDEIGRRDLPAMLDYALRAAGRAKLQYVGHSQGTTAFFVLCAERPEYNRKVSLMVALSAVAWMSHLKSPLVRLASPLNPFLFSLFKRNGVHEFLPDNDFMKPLKATICGIKLGEYCNNVVFLLTGYNYDQLNVTNIPVFYSHIPSGASAKQFVHYGQGVTSGKFQRFNYGAAENRKQYGSKDPPVYPVEKISVPVAIFWSDGDWLADIKDVQILRSKLKNVVDFYKVPFKNFNHIDFIWAKDVKTLVYSRLLQLLRTVYA